MTDKELAHHLLDILFLNDMMDRQLKMRADGKPTFCDSKEYRESESIFRKAAIGILRRSDNKHD